jgi:hypothetical protein
MKIQPPQFAVDVYRDLRDRRLLIPAAALLVALVAVPTLLARSSEPAPPPLADAGELSAEDAATQPAVVTETVSVRDYEERLKELKKKNPFSEHFVTPASNGGGLQGSGLGKSAVPGSSATPSSSASGGGPAGDPGTSVTPAADAPPSTGGSGSSGGGGPRIETRYFSWRIDATVGPVGAAVSRDGVKQLSMLPSKSKPVFVFLGIAESGDEAVFAISSDATLDDTDGDCVPNNGNCRYLVLKKGQGATFDYALDSTRYRLSLQKIRRVPIDAPGKVDEKL